MRRSGCDPRRPVREERLVRGPLGQAEWRSTAGAGTRERRAAHPGFEELPSIRADDTPDWIPPEFEKCYRPEESKSADGDELRSRP
ncbi:hypothetical protein YT1_1069 [Rhodococcus ruber]|nr:hypothetical protein YT1_1069 [Rhodococcus ruber]